MNNNNPCWLQELDKVVIISNKMKINFNNQKKNTILKE
jgi:hypothetical protein